MHISTYECGPDFYCRKEKCFDKKVYRLDVSENDQYILTLCDKGFKYWTDIGWKLALHSLKMKPNSKLEGLFCMGGCNNFCYHVEPNQSDGSFICFSCRNYKYYKSRL